MKYKIGDKVRVRTDLIAGRAYGNEWTCRDMLQYRGKVVTINRVTYDDDGYNIEEDLGMWHWTDEMFESARYRKK